MLICSGLLFQILCMIILDLLRARHWFACDGRHPVNGVLEGIPRRKVPFLSWKYILRTTFNWLYLAMFLYASYRYNWYHKSCFSCSHVIVGDVAILWKHVVFSRLQLSHGPSPLFFPFSSGSCYPLLHICYTINLSLEVDSFIPVIQYCLEPICLQRLAKWQAG